jgi:hypothetical protein
LVELPGIEPALETVLKSDDAELRDATALQLTRKHLLERAVC